jgi:hypothetical protein
MCTFILMAVAFLVQNAPGAEPERPHKTPVEVWSGGDDGLTQRLKASIEKEFGSSSDFQMSVGKKPGTLIVTIPSNVMWREKSGRTQALYAIDFTSDSGRNLGTSKGKCWDDDLARCAVRIVAAARVMVQKAH